MSDALPAYDSNQHAPQHQHQQQQQQQQYYHHRRESSEYDQLGFEASWASSSTAGADRSAERSAELSGERPSPVLTEHDHYSPDHSLAASATAATAAAAEALTPSRNRHH
jgi:hypothetical protein